MEVNEQEYYSEYGFYSPIDVLTPEEVDQVNLHVEEYAKRHPLTGDFRFRAHLLTTWAWDLIHHPKIVKSVSEALGTSDIICWSSDFNIKRTHSDGFFSWHQDSTYCGMTPVNKVVTAWIALTSSTKENGCVCFLPSTHKTQLEHKQIPDKNNMLSLGQQVVDECFLERNLPFQVYAELKPGQMSLHNALLVHASRKNKSDFDRVGFAIRYMAAEVQKERHYLHKEWVTLVSGAKQHDLFDYEQKPIGDFDKESYRQHRLSMDAEKKNYFIEQNEQNYRL